MNDRSPNLLTWQWNGYPQFHADRKNLLIHVVSQPFFVLGFFSLVTSPLAGGVIAIASQALGGVITMAIVMALQGRGHRIEKEPPIPFAGPLDVIGRIFFEQLINWPRFVLSGGFSRAWRAAH